MRVITIPNLDKFQHYKDKKPFWIKWQVGCLTDERFNQLKDNEKWLFIGLVILATQNKNRVLKSYSYIVSKLSYTCLLDVELVLGSCRRGVAKMEKLKLIKTKSLDIEEEVEKEKEEEKKKTPLLKNNPKRFYKITNEEMRFSAGKWWVIPKDGGKWLEFAGEDKDTYFK